MCVYCVVFFETERLTAEIPLLISIGTPYVHVICRANFSDHYRGHSESLPVQAHYLLAFELFVPPLMLALSRHSAVSALRCRDKNHL